MRHVIVTGALGGAERIVIDLARDPEIEHSVALATPNPAVRAVFEASGVPLRVHERRGEGGLHDLALALGSVDWLRGDVDLLHLHTVGSHAVGARARIPFVRTEHSTRAYRDLSAYLLGRRSLKAARKIVAVSEYVAGVARARSGHDVTVVRNGVDLSRFEPAPPPRELRFAVVGRLEPRKAVERAIAAIAQVPGAALDIVGDGPERARLEERARPLGSRVRFHGHLADPRPVVAACAAVLSSAREEALSIALLEGMAQARPAIAVPVGGMPEIVRPGETGLLAARDDVSALVEVLRAVDLAALAALGRSARAFVEREASLEAMWRGYRAVYASCR